MVPGILSCKNFKVSKMDKLDDKELEYLESLSSAVLQKTPKRSKIVLYLWILTIVVLIVWASIAKVNEIVRSQGKVIPSGENKIVQNLEGGIVEDILVKEGENVKKDQILLKIKNIKSDTNLKEYKLKANDLKAKLIRLKAEFSSKKFVFDKDFISKYPKICQREMSLYKTDLNQLSAKIDTLKKQIAQKNDMLRESMVKIRNLKKSYNFILEEIKMSEPMVKEGVKSRVDFLKLKREANSIKTELDNTINTIPQIKSSKKEIYSKIKELQISFIQKAKKDYNDISGELERVQEKISAFKDMVSRTYIKSPVDGIIKKMYVNTIGGVVKPGMDLVEIVPKDKNLIVEVKVKPKDIAFIYPGQDAMVKFTAYNFSIYGGLKGKVIGISPDTITDRKNRTYYLVKIKTDKSVLEHNGKNLKIIPGMVVNADIITGKRTVLDYLLKPILNSKDYIFAER